MPSELLGVALVTGASQGIGRAIALRLAKDGYNVALNDLITKRESLDDVSKQIALLGRHSIVVPGDVSLEKDVTEMVNHAVQALGSLDVMIANAGIGTTKPFLQSDVADWDATFAVNARGTYLCYKYAAKQMIAQGRGGRLIAASSLAGKQAWPFLAAYSASKFAVCGLTQSAALDLAPYGITVNAYAPGTINTRMMAPSMALLDERHKAILSQESELIPLGRPGTPDEVAGLVSYLVSKDASYITGQTISINGGRFFE